MTADLGPAGVWLANAAMALVTVMIRARGCFLMGHVPLTPRVRGILNALPGAVVVAIVLPLVVRGGLPAWVAVAASVAVMVLRRNDMLAVVCGMAAAALIRAF
jgi:uncharacterized membrane protein